MNMDVQQVSIGREKAFIVPEKVWEKIMSVIEDAEDVVAYDRAKARDDGRRISIEDVEKRVKKRRR